MIVLHVTSLILTFFISTDVDTKLNFSMNLKLTCDSPWVFVPEMLNMAYASRTFSVRIDPCALPVGEHFTWVSPIEVYFNERESSCAHYFYFIHYIGCYIHVCQDVILRYMS